MDGTVELNNWGTIRGLDASPGNNPEGVSIGGGVVRNHAGAEISGDNRLPNGTLGQGLLVDDSDGGPAFAATTLTNAGLIRGHQGFAVKMIGDFDDTIDNLAGGTLRGAGPGAAVQTGGGNDRLTNAGAIIGEGGVAIDLGDGDDTLVISGGAASVAGTIAGGTGTDQMLVTPGVGNRFGYNGTITGFDSILIESGRAELAGTIEGVLTVASGATLAPGASVGSLDLVDLALSAGGVLAIDLDPRNLGGNGTADQVRVSGGVALGFADLLLSLLSLPTPGEVFTVVLNAGADPIGGQFAQGDRVAASFAGRNYWFAIDYGQDLRLTALVPVPATLWLLVAGWLGLRLARRA